MKKINKVLGTSLTEQEVEDIFRRLGFGTAFSEDTFTVSVPPRRWDIEIDADLLEEVARIYGYDNRRQRFLRDRRHRDITPTNKGHSSNSTFA